MPTRILAALVCLLVIAAACTASSEPAVQAPDPVESTTSTVAPSTESTAPPEVDRIDGDGQRLVPEEEKPDLELALIWHQHQPDYPVIDGTISRPWVRLHAAKDYVDMATIVEEFPDLRLTFNLTPGLLDQLVELESIDDIYETVARIPVADLTPEQRRFHVDRYFDINPQVIRRSDRFEDLLGKRDTGGDFDDQDLHDLRTLFHLGWIDPEFVEEDATLRRLRNADGGFTDADTIAVLNAIDGFTAQVIPAHTELWDSDRIEVITSPLAHPILPLIADSDLALVGDPAATMPRQPFRQPGDAALHVERGLDQAAALLGQTPNGMWPGEGAVAQEVMGLFAANDVQWVGTGEDVLARSLDIGSFDRNGNGTVIEAERLYQPWRTTTADGEVALFFRDQRLSDLIGFEYSGRDADEAAADLLRRLDDIRSQLARRGVEPTSAPPLVTLVIDGENAWESYPNDGRDFLRALYTSLTETEWLRTTTPSTYLRDHPDAGDELDEVYPAAWFSPNFSTWIGEAEEARAWELLGLARNDLAAAVRRGSASTSRLDAATDAILKAEGSDWFWWYGDDQDSGDDRYFDRAFRELLGQMYDALGQTRPPWVSQPIIPDPRVVPVRSSGEPVSVTVDGNPADFADAITFDFTLDNDVISTLAIAVDGEEVGLLFEGGYDDGMDVYLGTPQAGADTRGTSIDNRFQLGFGATHIIRWSVASGACISTGLAPEAVADVYPEDCMSIPSALSAAGLEMSVPTSTLGDLTAGDRLRLRIQTGASLSPSTGPAEAVIPDIASFEAIREITDRRGDDHGPGTYRYPTDPVFTPGSYDLVEFLAGESAPGPEGDFLFSFLLDAPIDNPWNSPIGLSLQTIDLYLDYDPDRRTGRNALLDGRNASLPDGRGWEAAITVEGFDPAIAVPGRSGYSESDAGVSLSILAEQGLVTVRVAKSALPAGLDLSTAGLAVAVLSQDGFPSTGVRRVRDIAPEPSQWVLGGGNSAAGDTRVIDALFPGSGTQNSLLTDNVLPINLP